jgi:hypothetical protein
MSAKIELGRKKKTWRGVSCNRTLSIHCLVLQFSLTKKDQPTARCLVLSTQLIIGVFSQRDRLSVRQLGMMVEGTGYEIVA